MVVDADLVESCVLVAVMVAAVPVVGAVNTPAELMVPAEADQETAEEKLPVPCTGAEQVVLPPCTRLFARQETATLVIVLAGVRAIVVDADLVES